MQSLIMQMHDYYLYTYYVPLQCDIISEQYIDTINQI